MIDVIDYGGGNLGSLMRCLERLNVAFQKVDNSHPPSGKNPLILPGVGAFGATMESLMKNDFHQQIVQLVCSGTPYLGICVGLQVLFETSEESPDVPGLKLIPGKIVKFKAQKVPQIGWNLLQAVQGQSQPVGHVYFVNSFYAQPVDPSVILYQADYEGPFCAAIQKDNMTAFQFHPEKSGQFGHELLRSWVDAL